MLAEGVSPSFALARAQRIELLPSHFAWSGQRVVAVEARRNLEPFTQRHLWWDDRYPAPDAALAAVDRPGTSAVIPVTLGDQGTVIHFDAEDEEAAARGVPYGVEAASGVDPLDPAVLHCLQWLIRTGDGFTAPCLVPSAFLHLPCLLHGDGDGDGGQDRNLSYESRVSPGSTEVSGSPT